MSLTSIYIRLTLNDEFKILKTVLLHEWLVDHMINLKKLELIIIKTSS